MKICENCTGCMSCLASCPYFAISVGQNEEGFYIPVVDENKCTNCGLCKKKCPQNQVIEENKKIEPVVYAVISNNELVQKSSSGGIFSVLSEYVIEKKGYVCGAAFSEDFKKVEHIIIDNKEDLTKLRTSKYLQSYIGDVYVRIKELLDDDNYVLFAGTPCQATGLKSYLKKDYEKLLTIDIVCHSVPSPLVWAKYLEEVSNRKEIKYINFRDKVRGWQSSTLEIQFKDGTIFEEENSCNPYFNGFIQGIICNKACSNCRYSNLNKITDFTLGDFWGIEKFSETFKTNNGVSLVMLNSIKAETVFNMIIDKLSIIEERDVKEATCYNPMIISSHSVHPNREAFFNDLYNLPVNKNITEKFNKKYNGIITNFWFGGNYGAVISAYAIQNFLKDCGFDYHLLNYTRYDEASKIAKNFSINHLKLTHRVKTIEDFYELNRYSDNFIVGTDQVFRYPYIKNDLPYFMLSYTDFNKKRMAFSASFGKNRFDEADIYTRYKISKYLNRFDCITTREVSGVDLCDKEFGINAEHIIDPVFLLDKKYWIKLINEVDEGKSYKGKILSYILDSDVIDERIYEYLEKKYGKKVEVIKENTISIQEFLKAFYEADYIITDSFHGACFSIIFNKKFLCAINESRGGARFESLKNMFKIQGNFVDSKEEILESKDIFKGFDKDLFENIVKSEQEKAKKKLDEVLNSTKNLDNNKLVNEKIFNVLNFIDLNFKFTVPKISEYIEEYKLLKILFKYRGKKIAFWGASIFLENFLKKHKIKNVSVIIDKDVLKHGDKLQNCEIIAPEKIKDYGIEIIIFSIKNKHEKIYPIVKKYLESNNPEIKLIENYFKED